MRARDVRGALAIVAPLALALASGCGTSERDPSTRVVVEVSADPQVREAASALRMRVSARGADAGPEGETVLDEARAIDAISWPATTTIVPREGDASRTYVVEVTALDEDDRAIVIARAASGFVEGEARVLRIHLDAACAGRSACGALETCVAGRCASAWVDPDSLPPWGEGADGGVRDGGARDAGVAGADDAGTDACTPVASYADDDGDGWGDPSTLETTCAVPAGRALRAGDCDDACASCHPEGLEVCDGARDEDCDGTADEGCACAIGATRACPSGSDVGACVAGSQRCVEGVWGPCEDRVDPVPEDCDAIDDDCDGRVDEGLERACGRGIGACGRGTERCALGAWGSCTAAEPRAETCNAIDDDCDGTTDEGVLRTFYRDADGDGFGTAASTTMACSAPPGFVANDDDCNDLCPACRPGGTETCDGALDEDCDGTADEGCACTAGASRPCPDGIDTGRCVAGTQSCVSGAWAACAGQVAPTAETCNASDDDCDARIDEDLERACGPATEVGVCRRGTQSCSAGAWMVCRGAVMPGVETCNGLDDDCDGSTDEGVTTTYYADADGDGWGVATSTRAACARPAGYASRSGDCDDLRAWIYPGAPELCDGVDQDCDGVVDEGAGCAPDAGPPDAGPPDAGPPDAGRPDAGPPDAGTADAGTLDGGPSGDGG